MFTHPFSTAMRFQSNIYKASSKLMKLPLTVLSMKNCLSSNKFSISHQYITKPNLNLIIRPRLPFHKRTILTINPNSNHENEIFDESKLPLPMDNICQEWTLEQDKLLYDNRDLALL